MRGARFAIRRCPKLAARRADSPNAAAAAESSGDWRITEKTDPITGSPASTALLRSSKTMNSALAVGLPPAWLLQGKAIGRARLCVRRRHAKDSEFGYRFDAKPGRQIDPRFLSNHRTIVIEAKADVEQFAAQLIASNVVLDRGADKRRVSSKWRAGGHRCGIRRLSPLDPLATDARGPRSDQKPLRAGSLWPALARSQLAC